MSTLPVVPMVLRGHVVDRDLREFATRGGWGGFRAPDPSSFVERLVLPDPAKLRDVHDLANRDVLSYLQTLGGRLDIDHNSHLQRARELSYAAAPTPEALVDVQYRMLPAMFERDVLEEMLELGIDRRYLEGWVETDLVRGGTLAVRAFGSRAVHLSAGNSPIGSAIGIIRNALTRGDALFKSPSNDPLTAAAIAQTMCDLDAEHPLTRHVAVAYWQGGDEALERRIYLPQNIEKIVAWGGFDSVRHVSRYLQPGLELVTFDPKRSASIIGAAAFASEAELNDAAGRLALDIGRLNQVTCTSARIVFAISGSDDAGIARAEQLAARTYAAMVVLPSDISTVPKHGIASQLKASLEAARVEEEFYTVIGGELGEGALIVSRFPEPVDFADMLGDRVANLVPVDNLDQAIAFFDAYTQTVGVYPDALKSEVREVAGLRGTQRVVSLGRATLPSLAGPQDAIEPLRRLCRWVIDETVGVDLPVAV